MHADRVGSVLAPPLDAETVYCHPDLQQSAALAVVTFDETRQNELITMDPVAIAAEDDASRASVATYLKTRHSGWDTRVGGHSHFHLFES